MARHQDRTWHVLPQTRQMTWTTSRWQLTITVIAFAFDGDETIWLTTNGSIVPSADTLDAGPET